MGSPGGRLRPDQGRRVLLPALLLGVFLVPASVPAYRFYVNGQTDWRVAGAEYAARWAAGVWGQGEELVWQVAPQSGFDVMFDSPEGALPYVERALAAWSELPTADIAWRLDGVGDPIDEPTARRDGRNTILVHPLETSGASGVARIWQKRSADDGPWEIFGCDVVMNGSLWAEIPEDVTEEDREAYRESRRERSVNLFVHEFGHCLGLAHAGALSTARRFEPVPHGYRAIHPRDPAMSYGYDQAEPEGLSADDVIGASLLRPAAGWLETAGSISGTLKLAGTGEPAPYAQVWALPVADPLPGRIGAFGDGDGEFVIEGLPAGDYALWAQPILEQGAHGGLIAQDPPLDLDDSVAGGLVRVGAGQTQGDLEIPLRRGRTVRAPPGVFREETDRAPATSIVGRPGSPCSGTSIRAESPYPADGPAWFSYHASSLRYDRWRATVVTMEWSPPAQNVILDWAGSYRNWWWSRSDNTVKLYEEELSELAASSPVLDISIAGWRIERRGSAVRHTMEIAWPESAAASLRFRSADGACHGEPVVVCHVSGCEIHP